MALIFSVESPSSGEDEAPVALDFDLFEHKLSYAEFPMLACLNPWGKTVFNRQQAPYVEAEIERVIAVVDPHRQATLREVVRQCQVVSKQWHAYLVINGD